MTELIDHGLLHTKATCKYRGSWFKWAVDFVMLDHSLLHQMCKEYHRPDSRDASGQIDMGHCQFTKSVPQATSVLGIRRKFSTLGNQLL